MQLFYRKKDRGFTLIELMVSLSIMTVILTVILLNQSSYTDGAYLTNVADELSLTLSQAQSYGVAVKELSAGTSNFSISYGLSLSLLSSGSKYAYIFFTDRNANSGYDGDWSCPTGGSSECISKTDLLRGVYIDSLCVVPLSGSDQCGTVSRADVLFVRPNTSAVITLFDSSGNVYTPVSMKGVKFNLKDAKNLLRSVTVYTNGQISVQ